VILSVLASFTLVFWLVLAVDWFLGVRRVPRLGADPSGPEPAAYPPVSGIIPARDEELALERSLQTVLDQDYPAFEVVVLNDRSTDGTGDILEQLRGRYPHLQVTHLEGLPGGWLGKNHALFVGAQRARGEWLLFTDADVQFEPRALSAAVAYALQHELDHLTALPHMLAKGPLLRAFVSVITLLFSFGVLRASAPATKAHAGLGAFNLLRRAVYEKVGGHRPIALRPDDDMMLGKLLKGAGFRQGVAFGTELVRVEWYTSLGEAIRGLHKNAFAGLSYSLPVVLAVTFGLTLTNIFPFVAVFMSTGLTRLLFALAVLTIVAVYALNARVSKLPAWYAALHPVAVALLLYATLGSAVNATLQGGIRWRGTFYPLEQLRRNRL